MLLIFFYAALKFIYSGPVTTDVKKWFKVVFGCGEKLDRGRWSKKKKNYAIHAFNTCAGMIITIR